MASTWVWLGVMSILYGMNKNLPVFIWDIFGVKSLLSYVASVSRCGNASATVHIVDTAADHRNAGGTYTPLFVDLTPNKFDGCLKPIECTAEFNSSISDAFYSVRKPHIGRFKPY